MSGIYQRKSPRALRVRAVADYFYSLGAAEVHRQRRKHDGPSAISLSTLIEQATWTKQMSGLHWTTLEGMLDNGPFRATISCVDASQFTMEAADLRDACDRGQTFEESVRDRQAVLGVSGGFFLYSEPDIVAPSRRYDPVDCLIQNGSLLNPPCFGRPCVIQRRSGQVDIQRLHPTGMRVSGAGFSCVVDEVNWHVWTRTNGLTVPSGGTHIVVIGTRVVSMSRGNPTSIPLNGWVLVGPEAVWPKWTVGQTLQFVFEDTADPVWNAMAGGPWLYAAGDVSLPDSGFSGTAPPRTFSADETGDCNLLPRMAVGVRPDNTVVFAAVDGRHFERALGMTLAQLGQLMGHLGCITSMNLDGGASKRMVVAGRVQDLSTSDVVGTHGSEHVRPVRTTVFGHAERYKTVIKVDIAINHIDTVSMPPNRAPTQKSFMDCFLARLTVSGAIGDDLNQTSSRTLSSGLCLSSGFRFEKDEGLKEAGFGNIVG